MTLGSEKSVVIGAWEDVDGFSGEAENLSMREVVRAMVGQFFLSSSGPCWDYPAVEIEEERYQPAINGVENVVMAGYLNCIFGPKRFTCLC